MTRAKHQVFVLTERGAESRFIEGFGCKDQRLDWCSYPAVMHEPDCLTIVVQNAEKKLWDTGTYPIRQSLQAAGFVWRDVRGFYSKSLPLTGFRPEDFIAKASWAANADGIEVCLLDSNDVALAKYRVDKGTWVDETDTIVDTIWS